MAQLFPPRDGQPETKTKAIQTMKMSETQTEGDFGEQEFDPKNLWIFRRGQRKGVWMGQNMIQFHLIYMSINDILDICKILKFEPKGYNNKVELVSQLRKEFYGREREIMGAYKGLRLSQGETEEDFSKFYEDVEPIMPDGKVTKLPETSLIDIPSKQTERPSKLQQGLRGSLLEARERIIELRQEIRELKIKSDEKGADKKKVEEIQKENQRQKDLLTGYADALTSQTIFLQRLFPDYDFKTLKILVGTGYETLKHSPTNDYNQKGAIQIIDPKDFDKLMSNGLEKIKAPKRMKDDRELLSLFYKETAVKKMDDAEVREKLELLVKIARILQKMTFNVVYVISDDAEENEEAKEYKLPDWINWRMVLKNNDDGFQMLEEGLKRIIVLALAKDKGIEDPDWENAEYD